MNPGLGVAYGNEVALARAFIAKGDLQQACFHLERGHVLGQPFIVSHVRTHWLMLTVELQRRRPAAVLGQALRIVLGALGSAVGLVPVGNTGGTDISMFKRLPIAPDLQAIIDGRKGQESG